MNGARDPRTRLKLGYFAVAMAAVAVVCVALFAGTTRSGFVFLDDDVNIYFNPHLGAPLFERLRWMFTDTTYVPRYMPLGWFGLSLAYNAFGLNAAGYHAALVALHAANSALVYWILVRFLSILAGPGTGLTNRDLGWALLGALGWAVNPMRVESVAWASGLIYAQAIFFCLASVLIFLGPGGAVPERARARRALVATILYVLSLLTYPIAIGVAPALLILDLWMSRTHRAGGFRSNIVGSILEKSGCLLASAAATGAALFSRYESGLPSLHHFTLVQRLSQAAYVWIYYLWKPWLPYRLSVIYGTLLSVDPQTWRFALSIAALCLLGLLCAFWPRFRAKAGWFLAAHLLLMAPMLGLTEFPHITYDRYDCFSAVLVAAAACAVMAGLSRPAIRITCALGALALAVHWSYLSERLSRAWGDPVGFSLYISSRLPGGEFPIFKYRRPAFTLMSFGRFAEANDLVAEGRRRFPYDEFLRRTQSELLEREGFYRNLSADGANLVRPLAVQHTNFAMERAALGRLREARIHLDRALELSPQYAAASFDRALVRLQLGDPRGGLHDFLMVRARMGDADGRARKAIFLRGLAASALQDGEKGLAIAAQHALGRFSI